MTITIKDLPQSDALDREAMRSVMGGAATGTRPVQVEEASKGRIVDYPPGFGRREPLLGGAAVLQEMFEKRQ